MNNKKCYKLVLCISLATLCTALPTKDVPKNATEVEESVIMQETIVTSTPIYVLNNATNAITTEDKSNDEDTTESDSLENEFSLLADRMPDLPTDEYLHINEDSTPLHFLKKPSTNKRVVVPKPTSAPATTNDLPSGAVPMTIASPIYITVPIYINTQGTLPVTLSIAGQPVPLQITSPAPVKNYTEQIRATLPPTRQTNRHRSNVRSKIYARHDHNSPKHYHLFSGRNDRVLINK